MVRSAPALRFSTDIVDADAMVNRPSVPVGPKASSTLRVSRNGTLSGTLSSCIIGQGQECKSVLVRSQVKHAWAYLSLLEHDTEIDVHHFAGLFVHQNVAAVSIPDTEDVTNNR